MQVASLSQTIISKIDRALNETAVGSVKGQEAAGSAPSVGMRHPIHETVMNESGKLKDASQQFAQFRVTQKALTQLDEYAGMLEGFSSQIAAGDTDAVSVANDTVSAMDRVVHETTFQGKTLFARFPLDREGSSVDLTEELAPDRLDLGDPKEIGEFKSVVAQLKTRNTQNLEAAKEAMLGSSRAISDTAGESGAMDSAKALSAMNVDQIRDNLKKLLG